MPGPRPRAGCDRGRFNRGCVLRTEQRTLYGARGDRRSVRRHRTAHTRSSPVCVRLRARWCRRTYVRRLCLTDADNNDIAATVDDYDHHDVDDIAGPNDNYNVNNHPAGSNDNYYVNDHPAGANDDHYYEHNVTSVNNNDDEYHAP
jgi:hypothetical protein